MKRRSIMLICCILLVVAALFAVQPFIVGKQEKKWTSAELKKGLEARYAGTITSFSLTQEAGKEVYAGTLEGQSGTYQIHADAYSGHVLQLTQLAGKADAPSEQAGEKEKPATNPGEQKNPSPPPQSSKNPQGRLSLDAAREIAMKQVEGTFEGIEMEERHGSPVYEVEIKTPQEQDVKVEIDSFTGQVLSILWED